MTYKIQETSALIATPRVKPITTIAPPKAPALERNHDQPIVEKRATLPSPLTPSIYSLPNTAERATPKPVETEPATVASAQLRARQAYSSVGNLI